MSSPADILVYIPFWVIGALVTAIIANSKGRSFFLWLAYGLGIWPVAVVHSLAVANLNRVRLEQAEAAGSKECPFCAETIKMAAKVCRFCGRDLPPQELQNQVS
ncbi:MAG: zinc ribbon domain-containing protein [Magnetospirillum sp.]|nr:zinc ribbon domain-containing protein [Magnetospirillum sp.]